MDGFGRDLGAALLICFTVIAIVGLGFGIILGAVLL